MALRGIQTNSEYDGMMLFKLGKSTLVLVCLDGASARFVLWIEIKHHPFAPVIGKAYRRSILRGKRERRSLRSGLQIDIRRVRSDSVPGNKPQQSDQHLKIVAHSSSLRFPSTGFC